MCFCASTGYLDHEAFIIQSQIPIIPLLSWTSKLILLLNADLKKKSVYLAFFVMKVSIDT